VRPGFGSDLLKREKQKWLPGEASLLQSPDRLSGLPTTPLHEEIFVATKNSSQHTGTRRDKSRLPVAEILLGICIAAYLTVAGVVHVLASPSAAAAIASDSTASTSKTGVGESLQSDSLAQRSEQADNSRECMPSAAIDYECIFN
jgi:hypothetical protein